MLICVPGLSRGVIPAHASLETIRSGPDRRMRMRWIVVRFRLDGFCSALVAGANVGAYKWPFALPTSRQIALPVERGEYEFQFRGQKCVQALVCHVR